MSIEDEVKQAIESAIPGAIASVVGGAMVHVLRPVNTKWGRHYCHPALWSKNYLRSNASMTRKGSVNMPYLTGLLGENRDAVPAADGAARERVEQNFWSPATSGRTCEFAFFLRWICP